MKNLLCLKCNNLKPISNFSKNKNRNNGYSIYCKECFNIIRVNYSHTINGLISNLYISQIGNSKKRNIKPPSYTKTQFKNWILSQDNFNDLYNNWVLSGYDKYLRPSVDRINDYNNYTFDNIQLITFRDNLNKVYYDQKNGINTKQCASVLQYDLNGVFIKEYYSTHQASRETNIWQGNIYSACNGNLKTAGKYIWKFKESRL